MGSWVGSACSCTTGWPEVSCRTASGSSEPAESAQACRLPEDVPTYAVPPCAATHVMMPCPAVSVATVTAFAASATALTSEYWRRPWEPRRAACNLVTALECGRLAGSTPSNTFSISEGFGFIASSVWRVASGLVSA